VGSFEHLMGETTEEGMTRTSPHRGIGQPRGPARSQHYGISIIGN
jgi:hypothetical protein